MRREQVERDGALRAPLHLFDDERSERLNLLPPTPRTPPVTPHPSPLTPHPSPLTPRPSPLSPHPSPLTPRTTGRQQKQSKQAAQAMRIEERTGQAQMLVYSRSLPNF